MRTLVVPLFGGSPALISDLVSQINPSRIILCHISTKNDSTHHNAEKLGYSLRSKYGKMDNISVIPLGCSEHPLALGEAFSSMIINDSQNNPNNEYHTLISHNAPVGYFFGLTMLSILNPVRVFCYMSYNNLDVSRTHPSDFSGDIEERNVIRQMPLFDQFDKARIWLTRTQENVGSNKVFAYIIGWYNEDRNRYKERSWFRTSIIIDYASRVKKEEIKLTTMSNQIGNIRDMPEAIKLIEKNEENSREYRITPLGRSVGWIMGLTDQYPNFKI